MSGDGGGAGAAGRSAAATTRWGIVMLAVGAGVIVAFQIGKVPAALPILRTELGLDIVAASWVISMFNVTAVVVGATVGAVADRIGYRRAALAGLLLLGAASLAGAFAEDGPTILVTRFIEGMGSIVVLVAAPVIILRAVTARDIGLAFGFWGAYMPTGTAIMVALTPVFLGLAGWRGLWAANAVLAVVFALVLAAATRRLTGPRPVRSGASLLLDIGRTMTARGPLLLALCFSTYAANYLAVLGFLPTFLIEQRGMSGTAAALLTAFAMAANIVGNLAGGWLLHRSVPRWVLLAAASAIMGATSVPIYSSEVADGFRYLMCLVFSGLGGVLPPALLGGAPVHAPSPHHVAATNGMLMQGSNLGQLTGPPALAAIIAATGGWQTGPWLICALAVVGIGLALAIRAHEATLPGKGF